MENPAEKMNHDGSMNLPNRLYSILRSGEFSDCSFVLGTGPDVKEFKAHKLLLILASPVFRAMFNGELVEKSPIEIVDIRPEIFQLVLDFIYTDQCILESFAQARDVCYAADKYMISKLIEVCEKRILQVLDTSNACQAYEISKSLDRLDLMQRSLQIITEQTHLILKSPSFVMVKPSTLLLLLDSDELNLTIPAEPGNEPTHLSPSLAERNLLSAVNAWGIAACKRNEVPEDVINLRKMIEPALKKVRFLNFSYADFTQITQKWKVLTEDEIDLISRNISKNTTSPIMPTGFSPSRVGRKSK